MSHILLIEDDPTHAFIAQRILLKSPFVKKISTFGNGKEGYEGLLSMQDNMPILIFLDINMPVWDGWRFLQAFQQHPEWAGIPVFVLTSSTARNDRDMAEAYGLSTNYLVKPLNSESCHAIIERHSRPS
jgi:CheY-like chemotaxis protein